MIIGLKDAETYNTLIEDAYAPLIEFVNSIGIVKLDESNVFGKYFFLVNTLQKNKG